MDHLSATRHFYYSYLGRLYAFAYSSERRTFLGLPHSGWLRLAIFALFAAALVGRWGWLTVGLTVLLWLIVSFVYRRARRKNYNKFVADETSVPHPQLPQLWDQMRKRPCMPLAVTPSPTRPTRCCCKTRPTTGTCHWVTTS
ncbi:MAG: hypothetical protein IPJ90_00355 [Anaerolineaceae bacterium]|nr:hypothetical protein [Anaerolineaceae bacterium]